MEDKVTVPKIQVVAVRAIIVNQKQEILVVSTDEKFWHLPGGWVDPMEKIPLACAREVMEETGLAVKIEKVIGIGEWWEDCTQSFGNMVQKFEIYTVCVIIGDETLPENWLDPDKGLITGRKFINNEEWLGDNILAHHHYRRMSIAAMLSMPNCYFFDDDILPERRYK